MTRDTLKQLEEPSVLALCIDGDAWPRGLLSGTPIPDRWIGLIVKPDGRRALVPPGEEPRVERGDRLVLVRNHPITVPLAVGDCPAAEGNLVSAAGELLVRWQSREHDLAALHQTLLTGGPLTLQRLADALADAGASAALRGFISARPAAELLRADLRDEFLAAVREVLKRFAFETGLELERVARLIFTSRTYEEQAALERETRRRVERIRADEMVQAAALNAVRRRLDDLSGILEKLKAAAAADPGLRWHQLLPALAPGERGKLLENLWRITPDRHVAAAIVAVVGNDCLWLDPLEPERIVRRMTLGDELGGLRSVTYCPPEKRLLIGAAAGVWALDAESGAGVGKFAVPGVTEPPTTGFNAAVIAGGRLYATSSQLGCWSWRLAEPGDARPILVPEGGVPKRVRAAAVTDDGRVLFAADDCVQCYDPHAGQLSVLSAASDVIHCMSVLEDKLFVGTADGRLYRVDLNHPDDWWLVQQFAAPIETVHARRWSDLVELIVPAGARGVSGIYDSEHVVTHLLESATPIRRAWACDDLIVGLTQLRDRLVVMNANLPGRTGREARIARLTGQTIQDACIVLRC